MKGFTNNITNVVNVEGKEEIRRLTDELTAEREETDRLNLALRQTIAELDALQQKYDDLAKGKGLDILKADLDRFRDTASNAAVEFENMAEALRIPIRASSEVRERFVEFRDAVENGSLTMSEALIRLKAEFSYFLENNQNTSGGLFDSQSVSTFVATLSQLGKTVDVILEKIVTMERDGVKAVGSIGSAGQGTDGGYGSNSLIKMIEQLDAVLARMSEDAREAYKPVTDLVKSLTEYGSLDDTKLLGISQAFRGIADIGSGRFGTQTVNNIIHLATQLKALGNSGAGAIRLDFTGLNGLKVSKASLNNLATYLPQIANIDVSKLAELSRVDLTNFNNVKVSKGSIEAIANLTESLRVLQTTQNAVVKSTSGGIEVGVKSEGRYGSKNDPSSAESQWSQWEKQKDDELKMQAQIAATFARNEEAARKEAEAVVAATEKEISGFHKREDAYEIGLLKDFDKRVEASRAARENAEAIIPKNSQQYVTAMKQIDAAIREADASYQKFTAAKTGKSSVEYADLADQSQKLKEYRAQLEQETMTRKQFDNAVKASIGQVKHDTSVINENGEAHGRLGTKIKEVTRTFTMWFSTARVVMAVYRSIKQMISTAIELDSAFTSLRIVTGATNEEMRQFSNTAVSIAKELGKSVTSITGSIETFSRLGYNLEDASTLAKYATILSNVANVDVNEATTGLTSIIKGFNLDVSEAEHVSDVLVKVGQSYAVSASEMMEAYEKSGAALHATNTSLEKSAGLIAAANASVECCRAA